MHRIARLAALLFAAAGLAHGQMPIVPGEPALAPKVRAAQLRVSPAQPKPTVVLSPVSDAEVALVRAANQRAATKRRAESARRYVESAGYSNGNGHTNGNGKKLSLRKRMIKGLIGVLEKQID